MQRMMKKLVRTLTALVWRRAERGREKNTAIYQPPRAEQIPNYCPGAQGLVP